MKGPGGAVPVGAAFGEHPQDFEAGGSVEGRGDEVILLRREVAGREGAQAVVEHVARRGGEELDPLADRVADSHAEPRGVPVIGDEDGILFARINAGHHVNADGVGPQVRGVPQHQSIHVAVETNHVARAAREGRRGPDGGAPNALDPVAVRATRVGPGRHHAAGVGGDTRVRGEPEEARGGGGLWRIDEAIAHPVGAGLPPGRHKGGQGPVGAQRGVGGDPCADGRARGDQGGGGEGGRQPVRNVHALGRIEELAGDGQAIGLHQRQVPTVGVETEVGVQFLPRHRPVLAGGENDQGAIGGQRNRR